MPLDPASPSLLFVLTAGARVWQFDRLVECVEDFVPHARDQMLLRKRTEISSGKVADAEELMADLELVQDEL